MHEWLQLSDEDIYRHKQSESLLQSHWVANAPSALGLGSFLHLAFLLNWNHISMTEADHNLFITLLLGSKAETVLVKQPCYIHTKI